MKIPFRLFVFLCLLGSALCLPLWAEDLSKAATTPLRELMEISGINKMVEQVPALVNLGLMQAQQDKKNLPGDTFEQLQKCSGQSFAAITMLKLIEDQVAKGLSPEKIQKLLEWYKCPLAVKIIKAESESIVPAKIPEMQAFMAGLEKTPLPPTRVQLFDRLDKATRGTEFNVEMMVKTQFGMMKAMNQLLPPDKQQKPEQFAAAEKKAREDFTANLKQQIQGTWGYVYKDVADPELEEYIKFYEGPIGGEWAKLMGEALVQGMESASVDLGTQLMKKVQESAAKKDTPEPKK